MGSDPSGFPGDLNRPVDQVSWFDATNYCAKLTAREQAAGRLPLGWLYRLPTEAEWEYACRAGTTNRFYFGYDSGYTLLGNYAWNLISSGSQTHPVGLKLPNPWGLYDMIGNVWEWCLDRYGPYAGGTVYDPKGPATGADRMIRGGSWYYDGRYCRTANRFNYPPATAASYTDFGFRAVLASGQP